PRGGGGWEGAVLVRSFPAGRSGACGSLSLCQRDHSRADRTSPPAAKSRGRGPVCLLLRGSGQQGGTMRKGGIAVLVLLAPLTAAAQSLEVPAPDLTSPKVDVAAVLPAGFYRDERGRLMQVSFDLQQRL